MDDDRPNARDILDEDDTRTPAWYWSRLELEIGVVLVLLIGFMGSSSTSPCFGCTDAITLGPLLMRPEVLVAVVALALAVVGLIWMVRILRGPRDEPPPWRYRKR